MTIVDLYPTSVGTNDGWFLGAGTDKVAAVQTANGLTEYIYENTNTSRFQTFHVDDLPAAADTITQIQLRVNAKAAASLTIQLRVRDTSNTDDTAAKAISTSFGQLNNLWTQNPWTSSDWTVSEINSLQVGVINVYFLTPILVEVSQIFLRVEYEEASTGGVGKLVNGGLVNSGLVGGRLIG